MQKPEQNTSPEKPRSPKHSSACQQHVIFTGAQFAAINRLPVQRRGESLPQDNRIQRSSRGSCSLRKAEEHCYPVTKAYVFCQHDSLGANTLLFPLSQGSARYKKKRKRFYIRSSPLLLIVSGRWQDQPSCGGGDRGTEAEVRHRFTIPGDPSTFQNPGSCTDHLTCSEYLASQTQAICPAVAGPGTPSPGTAVLAGDAYSCSLDQTDTGEAVSPLSLQIQHASPNICTRAAAQHLQDSHIQCSLQKG